MKANEQVSPGELKYLIHTTVGDGPRVISDKSDDKYHLLDVNTGLPISNINQDKTNV